MSLEDSMLKLAASNEAVAASNNNLAAAFNNYANVLTGIANGNPDHVIVHQVAAPAGDGQATTEATGGKRGRKSAADKAAEAAAASAASTNKSVDDAVAAFGDAPTAEVDPFGEEPAETEKALTREDITKLVLKVKDTKGKDVAMKLLDKLGVKTVATIPDEQFRKVVELAGKVGVSL